MAQHAYRQEAGESHPHAVLVFCALQLLPGAQDASHVTRDGGWRVQTLHDVEWIVSLIEARAPKPGPRGPYNKRSES